MRKLSLILVAAILLPSIAFAAQFSDVDSSDPHQDAIDFLKEVSVINGYPDGMFRPENKINRAELLTVLVGSAGVSVDPTVYKDCFGDVHEEWFASSICYAKEQGWVSGYPDGLFRPDQAVNKVEAIKMSVEVNGLSIVNNADSEDGFNDLADGAWYVPYVETARVKGLLEEKTSLKPNEQMTRGGVSEVIFRTIVSKTKGGVKFREELKGQLDEVKADFVSQRKKRLDTQAFTTSSNVKDYLTGTAALRCWPEVGSDEMIDGSAFLMKVDGKSVVFTNAHVVAGMEGCLLVTGQTTGDLNRRGMYTFKELHLKWWNNVTDFVYFEISGEHKDNIENNDSAQVEDLNYGISDLQKCPNYVDEGAKVYVIGYPATGAKGLGRDRILTDGIVSGTRFSYYEQLNGVSLYKDYYVTNKMDSGNSGGVALAEQDGSLCLLGLATWLSIGNYDTQGVILNINNALLRGKVLREDYSWFDSQPGGAKKKDTTSADKTLEDSIKKLQGVISNIETKTYHEISEMGTVSSAMAKNSSFEIQSTGQAYIDAGQVLNELRMDIIELVEKIIAEEKRLIGTGSSSSQLLGTLITELENQLDIHEQKEKNLVVLAESFIQTVKRVLDREVEAEQAKTNQMNALSIEYTAKLNAIEQQISSLKTEYYQKVSEEKGKGVPLAVVNGRIAVLTNEVNLKIAVLQEEWKRVSAEYKQKLNALK